VAKTTAVPLAREDLGGAQDPLFSRTGGADYSEGQGRDAGPGDWLLQAGDGNGLGVFEGGVNIFRASDLAQILGFKLGDLIRVVARNFELFTDMGEFRIVSDNGKASMSFRGATNVREAHPTRENWDIECGLGEAGSLFYLRFLDAGKNVIAGLNVSPAGDIQIEGRTISEREKAKATAGARSRQEANEIIRGNDTKEIGGAYARKATTVSRSAGSGIQDQSGTKHSISTGDFSVTASHTSTETVSGYRVEKDVTPTPGQVRGKKIEVVNGNFELDVGNPTSAVGSLGYPASYPSIKLDVHTGDVLATINQAGSFVVNAVTGVPSTLGKAATFGIVLNAPRVLLGGVPGGLIPTGPGDPACKYNMLLAYLNQLHLLLDAHTHPSSAGPTGTPAVPFTPSLSGLVTPIASLSVALAT